MFNQILRRIVFYAPGLWVKLLYHDIWSLRQVIQDARKNRDIPLSCRKGGWKLTLYYRYWQSYGSFIGINAILEDIPVFPHSPMGVFISNSAHIGRGCVIFQQVTIGSNMLKGSKNQGSPYLEDNVYIGAGAKIIGNVRVGRNARIGANCVVVKSVPANSVTVIRCIETIIKDGELDNTFIENKTILNE